MVHEGKILHKLLKEKGIGETEVSNKFHISRRAVYNYYKSENLSNKVKRRFLEIFQIDINKKIHSSLYRQEHPSHQVKEPGDSPSLSDKEYPDDISWLKNKLREQESIIDQLLSASKEKDKRIESLEDMLKIALNKEGD